MFSYYKRLLGEGRNHEGGPSFREANDDFTRLLESQYSYIRPLSDHRTRHHR